jgi:photosystem II stability/assembly factor-like uncharacterized protein
MLHWSLMLALLLFLELTIPVCAQATLYASASFTKEYVVGAKLPPSGLFRRASDGVWKHVGFNHPFIAGFAPVPAEPDSLFLAAGNGLIRASQGAGRWTILTGSDVTELRDVYVDGHQPRSIYFAHSAGIRATHDAGHTWEELATPLRRRYTEAIRGDGRHPGVLVAGTEQGIFRSEDDGKTWRSAGAAGFQILRIESSPHDPCFWLAATQQGGLFASHDCGRTFENSGSLGVGQNLYDIAFDPTQSARIVIAGWGAGVTMSVDGGKTWQRRNAGLPSANVTSVAFDPDKSGRMFAAVQEEAVYISDDAAMHWTKDGLDGSHVSRLRFVGRESAP